MFTKLLYFCYFHVSLSIKCVYYTKGERSDIVINTTCEGDFCFNYGKPKNIFGGREIDKGCASGFDFPMGCVGDPREGTLCLCNTTNCNLKTLKGDEGALPTNYTCYNYEQIYEEDKLTEVQKKKLVAKGPVCRTYSTQFFINSNPNAVQTHSSIVNPNSTHMFLLPVGTFRLCWDLYLAGFFVSFYYPGGFYVRTDERYNEYYYKCKGDYCNAVDVAWTPKGTVNCSALTTSRCLKDELVCDDCVEGSTWEPPRCYGTTCIYGKDEYLNETVTDCWTVNETNAVGKFGKFTPGIYKFKNLTWILCNEDYCNTNETTALQSVERYRLALLNGPQQNSPNQKPNSGNQDSPSNAAPDSPPKDGENQRELGLYAYILIVLLCFFN